MPEDVAVWEQYIRWHPDQPWEMDYDIKVGIGRTPLEEQPPEIAKMWRDLTRKRIDAVAWAADDIYLIELKPRASLGAVGQVLGYSELWEDLHDSSRRIRPMIVCFDTDPDTNRVAASSGVRIVQVPRNLPNG